MYHCCVVHLARARLIYNVHYFPSQVGDNQCLLQSLKDSPYFSGFADKASLWESRLADLDEYLHSLNQIQRRWVYLEPIFGHGALPKEGARFKRVDDDFRGIMLDVVKDDRVLSLLPRPGLRQTLATLLDQLGRCQKALNEFLEVGALCVCVCVWVCVCFVPERHSFMFFCTFIYMYHSFSPSL